MIPAYPPAQVYRGDRYRLNLTAGALLVLVNSAPDGRLSIDDAFKKLDGQNLLSGIPGGPAGSQWNPPPIMPEKTYSDSGEPAAEPARYPDTLREYCTYFESTRDRVAAIARMLQFCGLVQIRDEVMYSTALGRGVVELMEQAETQQRSLAAGQGRMSAVQEYLARDPRDTFVSPHTIPFPVYGLHITGAVRTALGIYRQTPPPVDGSDPDSDVVFASTPPVVYAQAASDGATTPDTVVEYNYGDLEFDAALPIRRHLFRRPTYRQFLWIALNDRATFVLALSGVTDRNMEIVGNGQRMPDNAVERTDPDIRRVRANRLIAKRMKDFSELVLSGGPEAIWVGKPLNPKDVHADCMAFHAAGRPGFTDRIIQGSSVAWEAYDRNELTVRDFELAREALREGFQSGRLSRNIAAASAEVDAIEVAHRAVVENDDRPFMRLDEAGAFVERTANEMLREIGVDVEVSPEVSPSGVPFDIRCTYVSKTTNPVTKMVLEHRCRAKSIGGSGYCERHGGSYLTPEETASLVRATQQKLFASSSKAVEVMAELMMRSTNDAVRLRAAEQILNRSGLGESRDINVHLKASLEGEVKSASESVRERLEQLSGIGPGKQQEIERRQRQGDLSAYGETIEAEVVEVPDN